MMRKRRKAWGEEFRFCSYMPPFFFDFFFLAFVGLFTQLHIHNGVCLRILLFFRRHDIFWQKFPIGPVCCVTYRLLIDFSSSRHFASPTVSLSLLWESFETYSGPISFHPRSRSWEFPVFVAVCKKSCHICRLVSTLLTQQTCNQTYCESAGFHVCNVRMAVNRSVVGQTTFSTSEEVGRALVGTYPFLLDRKPLSTS